MTRPSPLPLADRLARVAVVTFSAFACACSKPAPLANVVDAAPSGAKASADDAAAHPASSSNAPEGAPGANHPWNVVLVTIDSLRADMPWAGYARPIAPRLGELQAKAVTFSHAYSTSSFTSKSVAGIVSGHYPSSLERTGLFFTKYAASNTFMCERLEPSGIPCYGGHAHAYFGKGLSGFEQGYKDWRLVPGITFDYNTDPYVTSDKLTPLAVTMLDEAAKAHEPFFAWFHYMDPHDEYKTHDESPHFGDRARDRYDEEVFYTDLWVGKLVDHVKAQAWAARTILVISADHGEAFGEHNRTKHAREVWEELVRVPLFFVIPGQTPRVIATPRSHIDLVPTFIDLLGAPKDVSLPGASLVPELRGAAATPRDVIVDLPEDEYNERRRALVHERYKLIAFGNDVRFSLFDLEEDPKEATDLVKSRPDVYADMRERYRSFAKRVPDVPPVGGIPKHDSSAQ